MNYEMLEKLINGETVEVGNKNNQIYYDKDNNIFVVEMYEYTDLIGQKMFSVADSFENIEIAIIVAKKYTCETYTYNIHNKLVIEDEKCSNFGE